MSERPFPWSREVWALLLDRLFASGARLVMFDLIFNPPNDGDPAFHAALDRYRGKVVVGANFDSAKTMQAIVPNDVLIPPPQMHDPRVGYVNFFPDPLDQRVRALPYTMTDRQIAGLPPIRARKYSIPLPPGAWSKSVAARTCRGITRPT